MIYFIALISVFAAIGMVHTANEIYTGIRRHYKTLNNLNNENHS